MPLPLRINKMLLLIVTPMSNALVARPRVAGAIVDVVLYSQDDGFLAFLLLLP